MTMAKMTMTIMIMTMMMTLMMMMTMTLMMLMMTMMMMPTSPKAACRAAGGRPPVDRRVHGRRVSAVT